jgi:opacity protein-like surface antigen
MKTILLAAAALVAIGGAAQAADMVEPPIDRCR